MFYFFLKTEQLKENQKQSNKAVSCTVKKMQDLEVSAKELLSLYICFYCIDSFYLKTKGMCICCVSGYRCYVFVHQVNFLVTVLQSKVLEAETQNEQMVEEKNTYIKLLEEERANSLQNQTRVFFYICIYFFFSVITLTVFQNHDL